MKAQMNIKFPEKNCTEVAGWVHLLNLDSVVEVVGYSQDDNGQWKLCAHGLELKCTY